MCGGRALSLQPVARATAAWGKGKLGVTLSALGSLLQRAPPEAWWRLACGLHELGAAAQLLLLLAAARRNGDASGCEGVLWCIAAIAHACGGRMVRRRAALRHGATRQSTACACAQRGAAQRGTARRSAAQRGAARHSAAQRGAARHSAAQRPARAGCERAGACA